MSKPLIIGNWKAYVSSLKEAKKLFKDVEKELPRVMDADVVVAPPHPFLYPLKTSYSGKRIAFGAQDAFFEQGAHTGEVTAGMVKDSGARFVIVGHAERRAQGETDLQVAKKVGAVLDAKMTPIVCIGEQSRDREGHYLKELETSIQESLSLVEASSLKKIVLAYEPVWAIGAPLPPPARSIRETIIFIRKTLALRFDRDDALRVRILYGGAVSEEVVEELVSGSGANGFLLGRASIDPKMFADIVRAWNR
ncbi:MAG: triose-phosphate isomerase [Patescibacteria group bacterium]